MTKPNTTFTLSVSDIELIEQSLRYLTHNTTADVRSINDLLGRIHNQKNFYRPKDKVYVGG